MIYSYSNVWFIIKKAMQIVITGGAGFIGSSLVFYHLNHGDTVHVIDDLSTGSLDNLSEVAHHPKLFLHVSDLRFLTNLETLVQQADVIYHFAAVVGVFRVIDEPQKVLDVNIQGTLALLRAMHQSLSQARLILASTSEIYGSVYKTDLKEENDAIICTQNPHRMNYAISKLVDEAYALCYYQTHELKVTILRIFNVIGKHQSGVYGMVVPRFIRAAIDNEPLVIYGSGRQKRSFCDIRDFVSMLIKIVNEPKTIGCVLNIGHDEEISINSLAKRIISFTRSHSKIIYQTYEEAYGESFDDFKTRCPDLTKLRQFINFQYQWNLDKTLLDLIDYARSADV